MWIHQPWVAQCTHWMSIVVPQREPFQLHPASLVLYFAAEPTYDVWVGGRLLDSPCVLEERRE